MEQQGKVTVPIFTEIDTEVFLRDIYPERRPAVLRGTRLGPCLEKWTVEYLGQSGGDKEVKIHVSTVPQMDFLRKNFAYKTLPFCEFVKRASEKKHSDLFLCERLPHQLLWSAAVDALRRDGQPAGSGDRDKESGSLQPSGCIAPLPVR